ncbi:MAG: SMC-Scp complex subunit ScpB [Pirellulales bacterium]|nr:SMC-Scp complex subunit ScpB [Pirellulales bacterium]
MSAESKLDLAAFRESAADEGLSLEKLSDSFASMISRGHDPYRGDAAETNAPESSSPALGPLRVIAGEPESPHEAHEDPNDPCPLSPRSILEAMLFVGDPTGEPLTSAQVAGMMRGIRAAEIDELVRELNEQYATLGCPYTIASIGAGYRLVLRDEFHRVRDKLYGRTRQARLSPAAIEVLAIVAYNEPLSADDINHLRGKPSGHLLAQLVRRQLLRVERGDEKPRRPKYSTTERFLEFFGLASLDELPRSEEIERR